MARLAGRADGVELSTPVIAELHQRYAAPEPRITAGRALSALGATAMIDISDGLATDARHLGLASGVELALERDRLPLTPGVREVTAALGQNPAEFALTAGEDFELCACLPEATAGAAALASLAVTIVGRVRAGSAGVTIDGERSELAGYEHSV